jgi:hypothetical protein
MRNFIIATVAHIAFAAVMLTEVWLHAHWAVATLVSVLWIDSMLTSLSKALEAVK